MPSTLDPKTGAVLLAGNGDLVGSTPDGDVPPMW